MTNQNPVSTASTAPVQPAKAGDENKPAPTAPETVATPAADVKPASAK